MQGFIRGWGFTTAIAAALMLAPTPVLAADKDVKAELASSKAAAAKLNAQSKALGSEVEKLKTRLVDSTRQLRETEQSLENADTKLKDLQNQKSIYFEKLYADQSTLGGLVSAAQKFRRTSMPQVLAQSEPLDAARASLIMKSMIPALHERSNHLHRQIDNIQNIELQIEAQLTGKTKEINKINKQHQELKKLLEKRNALYQETEQDRKKQEAEIKKLAEKAKNIEELVSIIKPKSKPAASAPAAIALPPGTMLPVNGPVRIAFGATDDLGAKSKGMTFKVRDGAAVVTPLSGTVKFAGPFQKYRQILIIEHQDAYHSLIAGLGRIDTVVGASLAAGEPVGTADSSGNGNSIYYELRQNGEPVNPQKVLVAQRKQNKG